VTGRDGTVFSLNNTKLQNNFLDGDFIVRRNADV
jgi:hypothetical protein